MQASAADGSLKPDRLIGIDAMRYVALAAVVFIHAALLAPVRGAQPAADMVNMATRFGVPFFFTASGYFLSRAPERVFDAAGALTKRIVIPFLVWTAIYVAIAPPSAAKALTPRYVYELLIGDGPGFHLWFLSSLAMCAALLLVARKLPWPALFGLAAALYALGLIFGGYSTALFGGVQTIWNTRDGPFFGFPFMAVGFYLAKTRTVPALKVGLALFLGGAALEMAEYAILDWNHWSVTKDQLLGTFPFGVGAFLLALRAPAAPLIAWMAQLGRYSMGVYAVHLMALKAVIWALPSHAFVMELVDVALTLALSTMVCVALARLPVVRSLVR